MCMKSIHVLFQFPQANPFLHDDFLRFEATKGEHGEHSANALQVTIFNNPYGVRFLLEDTILACVIPGLPSSKLTA